MPDAAIILVSMLRTPALYLQVDGESFLIDAGKLEAGL